MPELPKEAVDPVAEAIFRWYEESSPQEHRAHLGGSQIGQECDAFLWLQFRWAETTKPEGRMLRLWKRGWREEPILENELRGIGVNVKPLDPATGKQFRQARHAGHFGHGADGLATKVPEGGEQVHLVEYKTANDKKWTTLKKDGLQKAQPHYYGQVQVGMLVHDVERCLFLSVNKNDDQIHTERVKLDRAYAERLLARAGRIIFSPTRSPRVSENPAYYKCAKFCDLWDVCHGGKVAEVNCRTCAHATPVEGGTEEGLWTCALSPGGHIPEDFQRHGCKQHVFLPDLVPLKVIDSDGKTVEYEGGVKNGPDGLASAEFRDKLNG